MLTSLRKKLLSLAQSTAREVECAKCKHRFRPFADREIESFAEFFKPCHCPKCGTEIAFNTKSTTPQDGDASLDGPFEQPADSRIERRAVSDRELLFYIPASGRWGGLLPVAILWNLVTLIVFSGFFYVALFRRGPVGPVLFCAIFVAIGIALVYLAIRTRFATHLIYLEPETVRMQRAVFRRKTYTLPTDQLIHVKKAVFYTQNYKPVFGIEISAGESGRIRFGTALSDAEKNWLCWEIREFLRGLGAHV
jgi:hypothetical protein